jgi:branched-chain amino acid transport system permease protein
VAGALAAIAAIEYGATQGLTASTADVLGFGAFPAIILGGIDSVAGVLVGAVILAEAEGLSVLYIGGQFSDIVGYLILLAVLLVRPRGLFGSREVVRL